MKPTGARDHLIGLSLASAFVVLLLATAGDLGMARDEGIYVRASQSYAGWFRLLSEDAGAALEPSAIDRAWSDNHEHPSLVKSAFALSWLAHQAWDVYPTESDAFRVPGMVMSGLLLWLLYVFGAQAVSRRAGAVAAVSFALMPRVFYHAHLDAFDVPITLMTTWVIYCYWRSLESPRWAVWTGIAFGLALATKHNSWIVPGILLVHWLWVQWGEWRRVRAGDARAVSVVPWWLVAMALAGPPIFFGSWPWMWHDTAARLDEYVAFHVNHDYYNMAYFGRNYFWPPFPMSFPWVMTLFTVPLATLMLFALGIGSRARALLPGGLRERLWKSGAVEPGRAHTEVLFVGALLTPMLVISLPSSPIFGGTKHWFPAYPFVALFCGVGFELVVRGAERSLERHRARLERALSWWWRPTAAATMAAVVLAPAAVETVHSHPFGLSHYTVAAGGVPGAADYGMNRQFWGFTTRSLVDWFNEQMPDGGSVYVCDMRPESWEMLHRDGLLPPSVRMSASLPQADFVIVHHEHHFAEVDFQAWVAFGSVQPVYVLTYDGVPIITVYENPRRRRARPHQ